MNWNKKPFYDIEDYSRCEDCGENELNCQYIDDEPYCEGCYDNAPHCEACAEKSFELIEVEYQTIKYSDTDEYDHDEKICSQCLKTLEQDEFSINIKIKKDGRK